MVLKNIKKNNELKEKGFTIIDFDFENKNKFLKVLLENNLLEKKNNKSEDPFNHNFHCTFFERDLSKKKRVYEILKPFFDDFLSSYFNNFSICQINIFNKPAFEGGELLPHQNLTVINENEGDSFSIWAPLISTNISNGTMYVLPSSHQYGSKYRNTSPAWPLNNYFEKNGFKGLTPIPVFRNQVLILNDRLIHGTSKNVSDNSRLVFHCIAKPSNQKSVTCVIDKEIKMFEVEEMFWQSHYPQKKINYQELKLLEQIPFYNFNKEYLPIIKMIEKNQTKNSIFRFFKW